MTRALVLGGGGVSGIAWETGVLKGLRDGGLEVATWDLVVGTSAGAVVGARLLGDSDLAGFFEAQARDAAEVESRQLRQLAGRVGAWCLIAGRNPRLAWMPRLWLLSSAAETFVRHAAQRRPPLVRPAADGASLHARTAEPDPALARIGALALAARAARQEVFVDIVRTSLGSVRNWPEHLVITAVDALDGSLVAFDEKSGVALADAVAASAAVPGILPPVTIGGRPYIDGGVASFTNVLLARGYDEVLVLAPLADARVSEDAQVVRSEGVRVDLLVPSLAARAAVGADLATLDPARRAGSARAGYRDGLAVAPSLRRAAAGTDSAA